MNEKKYQPLVSWGVSYTRYPELSPNTEISCPYCGCHPDDARDRCSVSSRIQPCSAAEWRAALIGFVTSEFNRKIIAGTATSMCPRCELVFAFHIPWSDVRDYALGCSLWPEVAVENPKSSESLTRIVLSLRLSAKDEASKDKSWDKGLDEDIQPHLPGIRGNLLGRQMMPKPSS